MGLGRWLVAGCLVALLGAHGVASAQQDALQRIDALQTLAEKDNAQALKQLLAQAQIFELSSVYEVKREYLYTLINAQADAGQVGAANATIAKLLELAQAQKDDIGIVIATSKNAYLMARSGKTEAAIVQLQSVEAAALRSKDPTALWRFYYSMADAQLTATQFEAALSNVNRPGFHGGPLG